MRNIMIPLVVFSGLLLGGCQGNGSVVKLDKPTAEAAKPVLSDEARQALGMAEADVREAKAQKALWTTADAALKKAKEAASKGDSTATLKFSKTASEQARLGLEQKNYPSTK
jgi:murein lipoprotein